MLDRRHDVARGVGVLRGRQLFIELREQSRTVDRHGLRSVRLASAEPVLLGLFCRMRCRLDRIRAGRRHELVAWADFVSRSEFKVQPRLLGLLDRRIEGWQVGFCLSEARGLGA